MINVHAYPFLALSDLTSPCVYRNRCFLVVLYNLIVRRPNLDIPTEKLLRQQLKIAGYSFNAMSRIWVCPYSYFRLCRHSRGLCLSFVTTGEFAVWVTKITSSISVSCTQRPTILILPNFFNSVK